jgi:hypothetical protein
MAQPVLNWFRMKMRNSTCKRPAQRAAARRASRNDEVNLPRMFLFLELFVDKDIPHRSTK